MNKAAMCPTKTRSPVPALLMWSALVCTPIAHAGVYLDGVVGYDYYVSGVDEDGFEWVDADLYAQAVVNDSASESGPLSLAGWLTRDPDAGGAGVEAGYLPIGVLPGNSEREVYDTVAADDVNAGEYHVHMLLQDDRYAGTYEDSRDLPPTLLWRGGLEAIGPLRLYQNDNGWLDVEFDRLDNRRLDEKYTNPVNLRLFATYGFGPASDGVVVCEETVAGLYSGDSRLSPGFSCYPNALPDGEYTLHLEVAESGGRGGYSTLTGPDASFHDGWINDFHGCNSCFASPPIVAYVGYDAGYYAGGLGGWTLIPLLLAGWRRAHRTARPWLAAVLLLPGAVLAAPAAPTGTGHSYSDAELDRLLAPIALYPDSVLSNVMIAATYPLEVAQAARWSRQHPDVKGDDALDAVEKMDWDASVKALVLYPQILERMDEDLEWTEDLGEAFLAQDDDVMDRVQYLRRRADDAGSLDNIENVEVVREREVIYIEPAVANRIYVPYYNPWVVYGSWWWPAYPPYSWSYWGGHPVAYYHRYYTPFYWSSGVFVSSGFYWSAFSWHTHRVVVVPRHAYQPRSGWAGRARDIVRHDSAQQWQHNEQHRRQVEYRHERLSHRSDPYRAQRQAAIEHDRQRSSSPSSRSYSSSTKSPPPDHTARAARRQESNRVDRRADAPAESRRAHSPPPRTRSSESRESHAPAPRQRHEPPRQGHEPARPAEQRREAAPERRQAAPERPPAAERGRHESGEEQDRPRSRGQSDSRQRR